MPLEVRILYTSPQTLRVHSRGLFHFYGGINLKTYIYPENLRANVKLWFWSVRDFIIICGGIILSVFVFANFWNILPAAATLCYAFLSLRADEASVMDYIINAMRFFLTSQQEFRWQQKEEKLK